MAESTFCEIFRPAAHLGWHAPAHRHAVLAQTLYRESGRLPGRWVERIEINEAFTAIVIVIMRQLGLPEDIVNVEGGAIAHGHPIGATGAVLTTRLIHSTV